MTFNTTTLSRGLLLLGLALWIEGTLPAQETSAGPLYSDYQLTLEPGRRTELLGPLFYFEQKAAEQTWAFPGLLSDTLNSATDYEEFHLAYPILTYNRYGSEYRWQLFQLMAFSGGKTLAETNVNRFTLFPFYFQQRSPTPELNYTAVFPIYGTLKNRLFRNEIQWLLWPLYVKTRRQTAGSQLPPDEFSDLPHRYVRSNKGDMTTYNFLLPFFHWRTGDGLKGWQFWPLIGHERKTITTHTNMWSEVVAVGGHDKFFALWPLFFNQRLDIGTTNPVRRQVFIPFYSVERSPARDATSYLWPFGFNVIDDRARQYREWELFWPLVVFARGEGKTGNRVLPFFSHMQNKEQSRTIYAWPVYRSARINAPPLDRTRRRVFYFLYSDVREKNTETGKTFRRRDAWPLFSYRRDFEGRSRLQLLALLEPLLPQSESVERDYSPLWALWRSEKNGATGASSQSLLWNLYRRESSPDRKKCSLFFGLFQYQSGPDGKRWRLFYLPAVQFKKGPDRKRGVP